MTQTIRIIAAVVDTRQLLLYRADGDTITIPQGDPRIRPLVDKVIPELQRLSQLKKTVPTTQVHIDLTLSELTDAPTFDISQTHYAEAEKKMGGVVKFFRMAKSKLKELAAKFMAEQPVEPTELVGDLNQEEPDFNDFGDDLNEESMHVEGAPLTKSMDVVNEIMANAMPSHTAEFTEQAKDESTTVVAVLEDGTVIPGMEKLDLQLRRIASKLGNPVGILKFFERVSTVKRGHTVDDLLNFMERGELPIADDGSILVYKRLNSTREEGVYVDCHSGKVKQRVGSHVFMDESLVDPNRRKDCSNGLHVARRDYLHSFNGDICVLAKLAPEDVIAVPHSDARKVRAKGYHIIAVLSETDHKNVTNNRKLEDTNLLGNAVAGIHAPILETVQIRASYGGDVLVTPVGLVQEEEPVTLVPALAVKPLETEEDMLEEYSNVDARSVAVSLSKPVEEQKDDLRAEPEPRVKPDPKPVTAPKVEKLNVLQTLLRDWNNASSHNEKVSAAEALTHYKKSTKKSWTALGIPVAVYDGVAAFVNAGYQPEAAPAPAPKLKGAVKSKKSAQPTKTKPVTKPKEKPVDTTLKAPAAPKAPGKRSQKEEAQHLWELYQKNPDMTNCRQLVAFKKAAKKSWTAIGLTDEIGKRMEARLK